MTTLATLVVLTVPCDGSYVTAEVRVYHDAWVEAFFDGHLCSSYQFASQVAVGGGV